MEYEPIKNRLEGLIRFSGAFRKAFYLLLDLLLLRQAYVKRGINRHFRREDKFRFYDAGAGFCQYSYFVLKHYPLARVFATDRKKDYLQHFASFCRYSFPDRFHFQQADLALFQPKLSYDLVIAIDILEHIEDDRAVLRNFHTAMNEGGVLIISTPSDTDEAAAFTEEHVRPGYDKDDLELKLKEAGFKLLESRYSYGKHGALAWKLLMKYPLMMLKVKKPLALLLPLYYLLVYLPAFIMNTIDLMSNNPTGTGLFVVAKKESSELD